MNDICQLRNPQTLTTGDYLAFEFLHEGQWKHGRISRTALRQIKSDMPDLEVFEACREEIGRAAFEHPGEPGKVMLLNSEHVNRR